MKVCRYDKDANLNSCAGCQYGCIEKPAIINEDFEKAVRDMEESAKQKGDINIKKGVLKKNDPIRNCFFLS